MLSQLIKRDLNRVSYRSLEMKHLLSERMNFMISQKETAISLDSTRLIAALLSCNAEQFRSLVYFLAMEGLKHDFVAPEEKAILALPAKCSLCMKIKKIFQLISIIH